MPYPVVMEPDVEEDDLRISVVDVYDLASEIGKEFEKLIDRNGADAVTGLMPMVISALEQLEKLATRHESTTSYIEELRATIAHLETEKIGKAEDRQKYEKELEEIEDRLREESHELVAMVSRLQDENRKLSSSLAKTEGTIIHSNGATPEVDLKVVTRLQEIVEAQREQLHKEEKDHHTKSTEVDNLKSQLEKVNHVNRELRRRQRTNNNQMRSLIDERAELQAALQEETRTVNVLRQRLGLAQKENEDLASSSSDSLDLTNKLVFDRDDPNRPRFTMTELKEILYERNELKARVSDLEDELEMYRPKDERQRSHIICPPVEMIEAEGGLQPPTDLLTPPLSLSDSLSNEIQDAPVEEEELPVQGPMPYEPEDAPWKKGESGIRKFFASKKHFKQQLKATSENPVSGDFLEMRRAVLVPEKAYSIWDDHECSPRALSFLKGKLKTNYCSEEERHPFEKQNISLPLFACRRRLQGEDFSSRYHSVFNPANTGGYFAEECSKIYSENTSDCCSFDSSLPKNFESNYELDVAGRNCLDIMSSGSPPNNFVTQCFEKSFVSPVFESVSVEVSDYSSHRCSFGSVDSTSFEIETRKRDILSHNQETLFNQQSPPSQNDLSSLQYVAGLDLVAKSFVNWSDLSCDEFLVPKFNFHRFYKPKSSWGIQH